MHIDNVDRKTILYLFEQFSLKNDFYDTFRSIKQLRHLNVEMQSYYKYALRYIKEKITSSPELTNSELFDYILDETCRFSLKCQAKMDNQKVRRINPFDVIEVTIAEFADYIEEETLYAC